MSNQELKQTGTTTAALVCKDGVVVATEHRATAGTLIAHKKTQKLFKIDDNLALVTSVARWRQTAGASTFLSVRRCQHATANITGV